MNRKITHKGFRAFKFLLAFDLSLEHYINLQQGGTQ